MRRDDLAGEIIDVMAAVVIAIVIACGLQIRSTYRECRQVYQFDRAFCAGVFFL